MKKRRKRNHLNHRTSHKTHINWKKLIFSFGIVFLFAVIGSFLTFQHTGGIWYNLVKPSITPPAWVFSVTWSILFVFIALSLYFALTNVKSRKQKHAVEISFGANFIFGVAWSFFFFMLRKPVYAFYDLILLWISIIAMILITSRISKKSAWLLVPYLVWVSFAGALNYLTIAG